MIRLLSRTLCVAAVTAAALWAAVGTATGEEPPPDPSALLRTAERASAPSAERLAAADALAASGVLPDPERAFRVATGLVAAGPAAAGRLARAALDAGYVRPDARRTLGAAARAALGAETDPSRRTDLAAVAALVGEREPLGGAAGATPFALEVARRDAPELSIGDALPAADAWAAHARVAALLDAATEDDPAVAGPALAALVAAVPDAMPLLLSTAAPPAAPTTTPPGRVARRVRAVVALGAAGRHEAVPVLVRCLADTDDGWVRAAAATALGDLRDPRAIAPLCQVLFYLGDRHRPHDGWEYPGASNTDVPWEAWADVPYFAVDSAAAGALLRLGVRGAAEWLIEERLDPRTGRWRVRVTQDAIDALREAFPAAPAGYEPDAGYPQRQAAVDALRAWWRTGPALAAPVDEASAGVREALDALANSVGGPGVGVMFLQINKRAAVLVGPPMTPSILRVLATSRRKVQRAELALVLGGVRDRRAVAPLLELTRDPVPAVRANAAEALAAYADPAHPGLLANASEVPADAIVARLLALLDDAEPGPRASAVKALAAVRPAPEVVAALDAHAPSRRPENDFGDYRLAEEVARLVHAGAGLAGVVARLDDPDLFRRRFVWELLHVALRLDPRAFDPSVDPAAPGRKPADAAAIAAALARRRGA